MRTLIFLLASLFAGVAFAQQVTPDPADSSRPYLSIFTHADYAARPAEAQLLRNVKTSPLVDFAKSCHFKHYTTSDPIYRDRFSSMFPESTFPVICVQRADGAYWYKQSGGRIPTDVGQLCEEIKFYIQLDPAMDTNSKTQSYAPPYSQPYASQPYSSQPCGPDGCPAPSAPYLEPQVSPLPDSAELFGGKTPIRDSIAGMASTAFAIVALFFLMFIIIVAVIFLMLIRPRRS